MRFGFGHVPAEDYRRHVRLVQVAEELGFDYAWIPDQTFHRDPVPLVAAMALATSRIRIGLAVVNPYTRHPAMVARTAGTLDEIAGGRFRLGIGAGNRKELLQPLGLDEGDAARRCREMAEIVRAFVGGGRVDYQGVHFRTSQAGLDFQARPDLEIYIAGRGPMVLQAAGAVADGAIIGALCTPAGIEYALEQIGRGASSVGRDISHMDIVSWVTCHITADRAIAVDELRPSVAHIIGGAPLSVLEAVGLPLELMRQIKGVYRSQGIPKAARLVTTDCVDRLAIVGDANECARRIRELELAGVTQFAYLMPPGNTRQHEQRLRAFASAIFPLVATEAAT